MIINSKKERFSKLHSYLNHEFRPFLLQLIALYKLTKEEFTEKFTIVNEV